MYDFQPHLKQDHQTNTINLKIIKRQDYLPPKLGVFCFALLA